MPRKWSKAIVVKTIKELHESGADLSSKFITKNNRSLMWAAQQYLGGWREAIEASDIEYSEVSLKTVQLKRTKRNVLGKILKMNKKGIPLNSNNAQQEHKALYVAATRLFGSWGNAVTASGIDYEGVCKVARPQERSKKRVVAAIKDRKKKGLSINGGIVSMKNSTLYSAATIAFPGANAWERALKASGIEKADLPDPKVKITKGEVIRAILVKHSKKEPLYGYYLNLHGDSQLFQSGTSRFGSWKKAIEAAGLNYEKIRASRRNYWTKETVIAEIQNLEDQGSRLSHKRTHGERGDLIGGAIKCFGSWGQAVEAAGFNYKEHALKWTTKAWLRRMNDNEFENLLATKRHRKPPKRK